MYVGLQLKLKGEVLSPIGTAIRNGTRTFRSSKPNIRADWQAIFDEGVLDFSATVEEKLQPIFLAEGEIQTGLEEPIVLFLADDGVEGAKRNSRVC